MYRTGVSQQLPPLGLTLEDCVEKDSEVVSKLRVKQCCVEKDLGAAAKLT